MHFRLVAQLSKRGADLGEVYFEGKAERQVAVLYQNDDYGKDYLKRLKDGLGAKAASMIVAEDAYEVAEPTIDSHAVKMKSLNADVFVDIATPKFTAQAIRKAAEISCVGTPGALRRTRLCRGQCARRHRKDFLSKVGELRQLALAVQQRVAEFQLAPGKSLVIVLNEQGSTSALPGKTKGRLAFLW
ncbi:hypothetical protein ABIB85_004795 [Bradyrhizobium sp. JR1.5]|uniref:ABC transporter substrate-binding protein n=1 Tax=unclassified Bradyrhizobium TaxID=2631580 RepID=UPI0002FBACBE|nr:ABC transporter substrate-binding protein [Bradyrhizobium sp. WSM1253]